MKNVKSLLPSVGELFFIASFFISALPLSPRLLGDGDTAFQIRIGQAFLHREIPLMGPDPFTFLHHLPLFINPEWLSKIIMGFVYDLSGLGGIVILFSFVIGLSMYLLFAKVRQESGLLLAALITAVAMAQCAIHWLARPHLLGLPLFILFYKLLDDYQYREKKKPLYLLLPLTLLWANLHASFIMGLILIGIYSIGDLLTYQFGAAGEKPIRFNQFKTLAAVLLGCVLISLINPNGLRLLTYPFEIQTSKTLVDQMMEFQSPNFHHPYLWIFEFTIFLVILTGAVAPKRFSLIETMLVLFITCMALFSVRHIPLFAVITAPILARHLNPLFQTPHNKFFLQFERSSKNLEVIGTHPPLFLWSAACIFLIVWPLINGRLHYVFPQEPREGIQFLKEEKIPGRLFSSSEFGDYLLSSAWPEYKIFIDSRSEVYGEEPLKDYLKLISLTPTWQEVLAKYDINLLFLPATSRLSLMLQEQKNDWKLIYAGNDASVFIRNAPQNDYWIKKYADVRPQPPALLEKEDESRSILKPYSALAEHLKKVFLP